MRKRHTIRLSFTAEAALRREAERTGKPLASVASEAIDRAILTSSHVRETSRNEAIDPAQIERVAAEIAALREHVLQVQKDLAEGNELSRNRFAMVIKSLQGGTR